ncbi:hypothetical protein JCM3766R1_003192 [Sporobolomyces carnicolor]
MAQRVEPDYNQDHPSTLFEAGTLQGRRVGLDLTSIRPFGPRSGGGGFFVASHSVDTAEEGETRRGFVVIKVVPDDKTRAPRNARREAKLLAKSTSPNVVPLLNAYLEPRTPSARITLFFPHYPYTLRDLIDAPDFVPIERRGGRRDDDDREEETFEALSFEVASQLVSATAHLHSLSISHRDINPTNVFIDERGHAVLGDFGIAVEAGDESPGEQHFEVGTGPYRAPELVFASRAYDAAAIDLWAVASTVAEMFRPFATPSLSSSSTDSGDEEDQDDDGEEFRRHASSGLDAQPGTARETKRQSLFTSGSSDFVLAASIFKVVGTPTIESWPEARHLANFARFSFVAFPPTRLEAHLPHLVASPHGTCPRRAEVLLEVLDRMLDCSASNRMSAREAHAKLDELVPNHSRGGGRRGGYESYLRQVVRHKRL